MRGHKNTESVLLFDMKETEVFLTKRAIFTAPPEEVDGLLDNSVKPIVPNRSAILAYPSTWTDTFGSNFYRHAQARELSIIDNDGAWQISEEVKSYSNTELNVTPPDKLVEEIHTIIKEKKQEVKTDGTGDAEADS